MKESAASYGVAISRADVKDLVFPGNLQEIMNRVLAAERMSQAQLVEARTKAEVQRIEAQAKAEAQRLQAEAEAEGERLKAQVAAERTRLAVQAEMQALEERSKTAAMYVEAPGPAAAGGAGHAARSGPQRQCPAVSRLRPPASWRKMGRRS